MLCWLVQAAITEVDTGPIALAYWNAANPNVPFSGPANSGQAQNTQRVVRVLLSIKSTAPQVGTVGTPPQPDPGYVGLHAVTTFFGKPGIEVADIVTFADAPRLRFKLPAMPPGYSQQEVHNTSLQWQAPDGVRWARVRVVGGGGGGGGGDTNYSGGGGGAGGYAEALLGLEPRQSIFDCCWGRRDRGRTGSDGRRRGYVEFRQSDGSGFGGAGRGFEQSG